jgi:thioredoxin 1
MHNDSRNFRVRALDAQSFAEGVKRGVVLVDFDEPWCGPCQVQLTILDHLARTIGDDASVAEVNVDEARDLAVKFGVQTLPTLLLFKNGQLRQQFLGMQRESRLTKAVQALIRE